ncbi:MAG: hypothetical protein VB858_04800 [Planctomycetaceae bacterium]
MSAVREQLQRQITTGESGAVAGNGTAVLPGIQLICPGKRRGVVHGVSGEAGLDWYCRNGAVPDPV